MVVRPTPAQQRDNRYKIVSQCALAMAYLNEHAAAIEFNMNRSVQQVLKKDAGPDLEGAVGDTIAAKIKPLDVPGRNKEYFDACVFCEEGEGAALELAIVDVFRIGETRVVRFLGPSGEPSIEGVLSWLAPDDEPRTDEEMHRYTMMQGVVQGLDALVADVAAKVNERRGRHRPYEPQAIGPLPS